MGQQPEHIRARTGRGTQRVLRGPPRATAPRGAAQGGNGTFGTVECLLDRYSAQETDCGQGMRALGPTTEAACRGCRRCPSRDPTRPYTPITTHAPITYAMPKHTSRRPPSHDAFKHRRGRHLDRRRRLRFRRQQATSKRTLQAYPSSHAGTLHAGIADVCPPHATSFGVAGDGRPFGCRRDPTVGGACNPSWTMGTPERRIPMAPRTVRLTVRLC
ncbi:hypothetical protein Salat_2997800 [Sesamum alatum]|uniref:Uncharacterized protein n=1 Tax=Sesamum alatum TaxID=300844 RepID=A0AAE1XIG1_9LAMI|nr:hypothetical protein Salat_2997800 [Sesamum alatum]